MKNNPPAQVIDIFSGRPFKQLKPDHFSWVNEKLLGLALKSSGDSIWVWDAIKGDIWCDDAWIQTLGFDPATFELNFEWWDKNVHPDSKPVFARALNDYLEGRAPRYELEYRIRKADGEWLWVWAIGICIQYSEDGKAQRFVGTHRNITPQKEMEEELLLAKTELESRVLERTRQLHQANEKLQLEIEEKRIAESKLQQSREQYRRLYNNTPAMLHSIDANGRLVSVSNHWLKRMGYERQEVIGRLSTDFLTEESKKFAEETVLPEFFEKGFCNDIPYQFVTKKGEIIDVQLSAISEKDEEGAVLRTLAVLVDITLRKKTDAERQWIINQLQKTLRENKTLRGILPICSYCKMIRTKEGEWQQLESFISEQSDASFSHSVCPGCMEEHYGFIPPSST